MRRVILVLTLLFSGIVLIAATLMLVIQAGWMREPAIRLVALRAHRSVQVRGDFQIDLLTSRPRIIAEAVTIGNPPWVPAGTAATIGRVTLTIDWSSLTGPLLIQSLALERTSLNLVRNSAGQANWQWRDLKGESGNLPLIHAISMRDAAVSLQDERRSLRFKGLVSIEDGAQPAAALPLQVSAAGELNTRAVSVQINGASLATLSSETPYPFEFLEQSSGSQIKGRGILRSALSLNEMEGTMEARGANLHDLYFLTGVTMVNTGEYRLNAAFDRNGSLFSYKDFALTFGQSDVEGVVSVETVGERRRINATLESRRLRLADIGERGAGKAALLLSDTPFNRATVLRVDGALKYRARELVVGRYALSSVTADAESNGGVVKVTALTANLLKGKLSATVTVDARPQVPAVNVDVRLKALQLAELIHKENVDPPLDGLLTARGTIRGNGSSVHQIAASAQGDLTAVLPHGMIRESFAESAGIDLRAVGMLLTKQTQTTPIRCGVASFQARNGVLTAQRLMLDTQDVLVSGEGRIDLHTEALDMSFSGHPKRVRLGRLRAPLLLQGTLAHPTVGMQARHSVGQAAGAVALGVVLTPLASILAFVDPGLTHDADCATLTDNTRRIP